MRSIIKSISRLNFLILLSVSIFISCEKEESISKNGDDDPIVNDYLLVASGQTTLYNNDGDVINSILTGEAFYGQDANYLKGESMSYTNNSNGTVTDNNTGLIWEEVPVPDGLTWDEAVEYCDNLELAGHDDWRMPNIKELFSISDFSSGWPYLNTNYFTLATGEVGKDEQYWSSNKYVGTTVEGGDNSAFGVNHVTGHIKSYPAGSAMEGGEGTPPDTGEDTPPAGGESGPPSGNPLAKHVRAVRGDTYGTNDYTDNLDGTITDSSTGLMWAQADNEGGINWEDALILAENSDLSGYTDWRLPNVKELQSIVDYSYAPGATDESKDRAAIDPIFSCTPTVNEAGDDDFAYYWTSTSANFTSGEPYYYAWYVAFGRAVNGEGLDFHGAGGVRFDTKYEGGPLGEGGERYYNYVRLVRDNK